MVSWSFCKIVSRLFSLRMGSDTSFVDRKLEFIGLVTSKSKDKNVQLRNGKRMWDTAFDEKKSTELSRKASRKEIRTSINQMSFGSKGKAPRSNNQSEYVALKNTSINKKDKSTTSKLEMKDSMDPENRPLQLCESTTTRNPNIYENIDKSVEALFAKSIASATRGAKIIHRRIKHSQCKENRADQIPIQNKFAPKTKLKEASEILHSNEMDSLRTRKLCRSEPSCSVEKPKQKVGQPEGKSIGPTDQPSGIIVHKMSPHNARESSLSDSDSSSSDSEVECFSTFMNTRTDLANRHYCLPLDHLKTKGDSVSSKQISVSADVFDVKDIRNVVEFLTEESGSDEDIVGAIKNRPQSFRTIENLQNEETSTKIPTKEVCLASPLCEEELSEISDTPLDSDSEELDAEMIVVFEPPQSVSGSSETKLQSSKRNVKDVPKLSPVEIISDSTSKSHLIALGANKIIDTKNGSEMEEIGFEEQVVPDSNSRIPDSLHIRGKNEVEIDNFEFNSKSFQEMFAEFLYTPECLSPIPESMLAEELGTVSIPTNTDFKDSPQSRDDLSKEFVRTNSPAAELDVNQAQWNIPPKQRSNKSLNQRLTYSSSCSSESSSLGSTMKSGSLKMTLKRARNDQWSVISSEEVESEESQSQFGGTSSKSTVAFCRAVEGAPLSNIFNTTTKRLKLNDKRKLPIDSKSACKMEAINTVFMRRVLRNDGLIRLQT